MNLAMILDMVADGMADRIVLGDERRGLTGGDLRDRAVAGARLLRRTGSDRLIYLGGNGEVFPVAMFAATLAGVPFLPVNYRLSAEQLDDIMARQDEPLVVTDTPERVPGRRTVGVSEFLAQGPVAGIDVLGSEDIDPDAVAVLLMTSGTTAAPKSAVLRHRHLASYIFGSVEFASASEDDATLVSVPPYHIAAVANALSNLFAGRRLVYLDQFRPGAWLDLVEAQRVSHAMVVPTMLVRIVAELKAHDRKAPPSLRSLSYGGAKIAAEVIAEALRLFPETDFVNAYGLTETASSIAVLGPEEHREAISGTDSAVRARLGSVGRPLPSVEIEVHDGDGRPCPPGVIGDIVVRGEQVAGEYVEAGSVVRADGWFPTRDRGYLDDAGFLFVRGRADDTIIRGGENIAPAEIEDALSRHEAVLECAVAGVPDVEWGQRIAAFVVLREGCADDADALKEWVRGRLRGSKTPDEFVFLGELPTTATGKILRRDLVAMVAGQEQAASA